MSSRKLSYVRFNVEEQISSRGIIRSDIKQIYSNNQPRNYDILEVDVMRGLIGKAFEQSTVDEYRIIILSLIRGDFDKDNDKASMVFISLYEQDWRFRAMLNEGLYLDDTSIGKSPFDYVVMRITRMIKESIDEVKSFHAKQGQIFVGDSDLFLYFAIPTSGYPKIDLLKKYGGSLISKYAKSRELSYI